MKGATFLFALSTTWSAVQGTSSPLVYTYLSLKSGEVVTTSTTFSGQGAAAPSSSLHGDRPTSYSVDSSVLAYPTYLPTASPELAFGSPAPGLPNVTELLFAAAELQAYGEAPNATTCARCQKIMSWVAARMEVEPDTLADIAVPLCTALTSGDVGFPVGLCIDLLSTASSEIGAIFPAINMTGVGGQLLCAHWSGSCSLPPTPKLDLQKLFKNTKKPSPKVLKPSGRNPLKVLHLSDYHLDLRYVVGSEADCSLAEKLCCRVFPYTNTSVPINQPASLFGNYLCDTPEALATSLFRALPKVTGFGVDEFAFGIFTGDLVTHDAWALTEPYVLANELASYQQFFNGLGDVPLYPTLGNHDTFPMAFTPLPGQPPFDGTDRDWNFEALSAAWENYGWLKASEAAEVVNSGLGVYRITTKEGLVVISLNSDVWYVYNLYAYVSGGLPDGSGMLRTLIDYLLEAEAADQPVWLIQHVNPGGSTSYEALPAPSDLWYAIVSRFNNTIRGTFMGHTHRDEFGIVYGGNATVMDAATAEAVAYIGPSVTPYQGLNAGFRYYLVDPDTFQIMDSLNFYADISRADEWQDAHADVAWQFLYSARDTYNYDGRWPADQPLAPAFWHGVAHDIATNETTFRTYTDLRTKTVRPYVEPSEENHELTICGLFSMSVPIFQRCMNSSRLQGDTSLIG